ncbi:PREDICTED: uncharacterized protein LOC106809408 [Priapulus caudatus]|uniref:Uncharacterized protein LOC106809408 n=1 Tax=Priapulus caudatus TaxID=37621 RepID=A0ABM1E6Y8_PRICU|nr:PREDICTED: uncharacterized protein LOC106809408 [Priapulus caudatus]
MQVKARHAVLLLAGIGLLVTSTFAQGLVIDDTDSDNDNALTDTSATTVNTVTTEVTDASTGNTIDAVVTTATSDPSTDIGTIITTDSSTFTTDSSTFTTDSSTFTTDSSTFTTDSSTFTTDSTTATTAPTTDSDDASSATQAVADNQATGDDGDADSDTDSDTDSDSDTSSASVDGDSPTGSDDKASAVDLLGTNDIDTTKVSGNRGQGATALQIPRLGSPAIARVAVPLGAAIIGGGIGYAAANRGKKHGGNRPRYGYRGDPLRRVLRENRGLEQLLQPEKTPGQTNTHVGVKYGKGGFLGVGLGKVGFVDVTLHKKRQQYVPPHGETYRMPRHERGYQRYGGHREQLGYGRQHEQGGYGRQHEQGGYGRQHEQGGYGRLTHTHTLQQVLQ